MEDFCLSASCSEVQQYGTQLISGASQNPPVPPDSYAHLWHICKSSTLKIAPPDFLCMGPKLRQLANHSNWLTIKKGTVNQPSLSWK